MKLDGIDIEQTLKEAELLLNKEKDLSPALKAMFSVLILVVQLLTKRLELNSQNTSKPPSTDPNRRKK